MEYKSRLDKWREEKGHAADNYDEMLRCNAQYKKVTRTMDIIAKFYLFVCIGIMASTIVIGFLGGVSFGDIIDGIFVKGLLLVFGYLSCYQHKNILALFAALMGAVGLLFGGLNYLLAIPIIASAIITAICNKQYEYLSQQPGFPYFNVIFEEQKFDKQQRSIRDPYAVAKEEREKTSSENMYEYDTELQSSNDTGMRDTPKYAEMDEI